MDFEQPGRRNEWVNSQYPHVKLTVGLLYQAQPVGSNEVGFAACPFFPSSNELIQLVFSLFGTLVFSQVELVGTIVSKRDFDDNLKITSVLPIKILSNPLVDDATGVVLCIAYQKGESEKYPDYELGKVVRVHGKVRQFRGTLEVNVRVMCMFRQHSAMSTKLVSIG